MVDWKESLQLISVVKLTVKYSYLLTILTYCLLCFWCCWLGGRKGIRSEKTEWWGAGVVICLERGADLHVAQLMPLPLTVSCFSKVQIGFTFLVPAHPGSPGKRAVKRVCLSIYLLVYLLPCCCIFRQRSPAVHRVITHYACPWPLIATRWFICLYVDVMPTEVFTDGFILWCLDQNGLH